jgi:hypothetical protein
MNTFPVSLVAVFSTSDRKIPRYLLCRWKNYERYKNAKKDKKRKAFCSG